MDVAHVVKLLQTLGHVDEDALELPGFSLFSEVISVAVLELLHGEDGMVRA